jgi:hypothetical protein
VKRAPSRKLAQPFGMNAFGGSRIEADRAQSSPLLDQARKGAMTGSAGRLTRPGQPADRCSLFCRQESIQRVRLHREQAAGQLMRDLALGRHHSCGDELIDNEWTGHNETPAPQLVHQRRGNFAGVGRRECYGQEPREHFATMLGRESDKSEVRAQGIELLIPCLKACGVGREGFGRDLDLVGNKAKRRRRYQFALPQQPSRISQRTELQGKAEPIAIAPPLVDRRKIGVGQGPISDQGGLLGRQGEQLIELCGRQPTASRHNGLSQTECRLFGTIPDPAG